MSFQEHMNFADVHGIINSARMPGVYADILTGGGNLITVKAIILHLKVLLNNSENMDNTVHLK